MSKVGEEIAKIEEMGQEDEKKAAKVVIEEGKETKKEDDKFEEEKLENLQKKAKYQFKEYRHYLADTLGEIMRRRDVFPKSWLWDAWADDEGVGLSVLSPDKRKFARAFKPVNIPKYDLNACVTLALQAENLVDKYEEAKQTTDSGIVIPKNGHG